MDNNLKLILLVLLLLYVISPVDAVPGPVDDALLCVAYATTCK